MHNFTKVFSKDKVLRERGIAWLAEMGLSEDEAEWDDADRDKALNYLIQEEKAFITYLPLCQETTTSLLTLFHCRRCGKCCKEIYEPIPLHSSEVKLIADCLHISHKQMKSKTVVVNHRRCLPMPCPFYNEEICSCTIQTIKPYSCKLFPLTSPIFIDGIPIIQISTFCEASVELCRLVLNATCVARKFRQRVGKKK